MTNYYPYPILQRAEDKDYVNKAVDTLRLYRGTWIITEKMKGVNFSINFLNGEVLFGKKESLLEGENYFGYKHIEWELRQKFSYLLLSFPGATSLTVYGVLLPRRKISYFYAFDILLNGNFLPKLDSNEFLVKAGFYIAPVLGVCPSLPDALVQNVNPTETVIGPDEAKFIDSTRVIFKKRKGKIL